MPEDRKKDLLGGQSVPLEIRLRQGRPTDSVFIESWEDDEQRQTLRTLRDALRSNDGDCYVLEATIGRKTGIVGALVLSSTMLDCFYLDQVARCPALVMMSLETLVDRYFQKTGSSQLLASTPTSAEGEQVLVSLGFEKKPLGFGVNQWVLTQSSWQGQKKGTGAR